MDTIGLSHTLDDFHLDLLAQQPRINRLYTQLTFCFPLPNASSSSRSEIVQNLFEGLRRLSAEFPWTAGRVVREADVFKIKPFEGRPRLITQDFKDDARLPTWDALYQAKFPFSMLDEDLIAQCRTLPTSDIFASEPPVFLIQANFITRGLLLTFNGQHGSMDMTGLGLVIHWLAKACRNERFTQLDLYGGNMDRRNINPMLVDKDPSPGRRPVSQTSKDTPAPTPRSEAPKINWAYFIFSASSLAALKSIGTKDIRAGSFVSTDDVLSAFIWQAITRARLPRFGDPSAVQSTLSRNVDVRRYLGLPPTYPGLVSNSTTHVSALNALVEEPLSIIASRLRSVLDPESLAYQTVALATRISRGEDVSFAGKSNPELDVRLSSWAKESFYDLDFGFGKPEAVRRPRFVEGAREGLVYFLPKAANGEIAVGVCLSNEDLDRLKGDEAFAEYVKYIG